MPRLRTLAALALLVGFAGLVGFVGACDLGGGDDSNADAGASSSPSKNDAGVPAFEASVGRICEQVELCYPDFQDSNEHCTGPVANGSTTRWPIRTQAASDAQAACLRAAPNQDAVQSWAACLADAQDAETHCLSSCPPSVDDCVLAGNTAIKACAPTSTEDQLNINACSIK